MKERKGRKDNVKYDTLERKSVNENGRDVQRRKRRENEEHEKKEEKKKSFETWQP